MIPLQALEVAARLLNTGMCTSVLFEQTSSNPGFINFRLRGEHAIYGPWLIDRMELATSFLIYYSASFDAVYHGILDFFDDETERRRCLLTP